MAPSSVAGRISKWDEANEAGFLLLLFAGMISVPTVFESFRSCFPVWNSSFYWLIKYFLHTIEIVEE